MSHNNGQIENFQLRKLIELAETNVLQNHRLIHISETHTRQNIRIIRLLALIASEVEPPFLDSIQIRFERNNMPTPGPITLNAVGQTFVASVVGFDQFGQPFTGELPPFTLSSDDSAQAIVTFDPVTGNGAAVADGVANITANLTTAEGVALSDTEAVTVAITPPPTPVLSSIKVAF